MDGAEEADDAEERRLILSLLLCLLELPTLDLLLKVGLTIGSGAARVA